MTYTMENTSAPLRSGFGLALGLNFLWINVSEVFRYFAFVMPMMRDAFPNIEDVAPMNLSVFLIWGIWDTILVCAATFIPWVCLERFGPTVRNAVWAGTGMWATVFVILWLGLWNMNLTPLSVLGVALPLAWLEMVVAALIALWVMGRTDRS